jgi:hypothetical protein
MKHECLGGTEESQMITRKIIISVVLMFFIYGAGYIWFRNSNIQVWAQDGHSYVIFPANRTFVYYLYRPLTYVDGFLTSMRFHIGPH